MTTTSLVVPKLKGTKMTEELLQDTCKIMLKTFYPKLILCTSLNGINLNGLQPIQKKIIVSQMYKGEADVRVLLPKGVVLNIELKRPSIKEGKGQSNDQIKYQKDLEELGHKYYLVNSSDKFFKIINDNLSVEYRQELLENYSGEYTIEMVKQQYNLE